MGVKFGFSYEEWMKRAVHERDITARRYKLEKAAESADTELQRAWAEKCAECVHLLPDEPDKPESSDASPTIEVST